MRKPILIFLVIVLLVMGEVECRRKILRGRKAVTRTYMKPLAVPAWAIVLLVAIGQIIIVSLLYLLLKAVILDRPVKPSYTIEPMVRPVESSP
ncbi:hypothetical protein GWI33_016140 [Rhynchophorus ferrugineus]|uniref:Uncharacterized protein n=1 Tax=Rhynchophorus ferrugineus TaxID=354439 RepID=A0A834M7E6_RHYFE|nr:hypothetical protein GWI33_016140 [Rhynchophorus ferrugineus]